MLENEREMHKIMVMVIVNQRTGLHYTIQSNPIIAAFDLQTPMPQPSLAHPLLATTLSKIATNTQKNPDACEPQISLRDSSLKSTKMPNFQW